MYVCPINISVSIGWGKKGNRTEPNRTTGLYRIEPTEISGHWTEVSGVISKYFIFFLIYLRMFLGSTYLSLIYFIWIVSWWHIIF